MISCKFVRLSIIIILCRMIVLFRRIHCICIIILQIPIQKVHWAIGSVLHSFFARSHQADPRIWTVLNLIVGEVLSRIGTRIYFRNSSAFGRTFQQNFNGLKLNDHAFFIENIHAGMSNSRIYHPSPVDIYISDKKCRVSKMDGW